MLALSLIIAGTFFHEIKGTIAKKILREHHIYSMWLILSLFGLFIFSSIILYKLLFSPSVLSYDISAWPISLIRVICELGVSYCMLQAFKYCDRSTFSMISSITIPLVFLVDIFLW